MVLEGQDEPTNKKYLFSTNVDTYFGNSFLPLSILGIYVKTRCYQHSYKNQHWIKLLQRTSWLRSPYLTTKDYITCKLGVRSGSKIDRYRCYNLSQATVHLLLSTYLQFPMSTCPIVTLIQPLNLAFTLLNRLPQHKILSSDSYFEQICVFNGVIKTSFMGNKNPEYIKQILTKDKHSQ